MDQDAYLTYRFLIGKYNKQFGGIKMLYSNASLSIRNRTITEEGNGSVPSIMLGAGPHRGGMLISVPEQPNQIIKGFYPGLTITQTHVDNQPAIIKAEEPDIYLILSSRPSRKLRSLNAECHILAPVEQVRKVVTTAISCRPGDCRWQSAIIKATPGDIYAVISRSGGIRELIFFIVGRQWVFQTSARRVAIQYEDTLRELKQQRSVLRNGLLQARWLDVMTGRDVTL